MPLALDTLLDQNWINRSARINGPEPDHATRVIRERSNWIKREAQSGVMAENPTHPCAFLLLMLQIDQYMDPWADVGLSLSPHTRDRHAYAWNNPVANTDPSGHDCSSGSGVSGGAACADAMNNYCKRHPSDPRCATGPVKAEHIEANDRQVIAASGGSPSYMSPSGQPTYMPAVVTTVKAGPTIVSLKNPITNFMIGEQVAFVQNPSWSGAGMAAVTLFKPAKAVDRIADGIDNAKDAKRATSGRATTLIDEAEDGGRARTKVHRGGEKRFFDEYDEVSRNGTRLPNSGYPGEFYGYGGQRWGFRINGSAEPRIEIGSGPTRFKVRFPQ